MEMLSFKQFLESLAVDTPAAAAKKDAAKREKRLAAKAKNSYTRAEAEKEFGDKNFSSHSEHGWVHNKTGEILSRKGWSKNG